MSLFSDIVLYTEIEINKSIKHNTNANIVSYTYRTIVKNKINICEMKDKKKIVGKRIIDKSLRIECKTFRSITKMF